VVSFDPHFRTPYIESWTLSLQHAIFNNLVLDVAYVGNHGVKLTGNTNDNEPSNFQLWDETVTSANANSGTYATNAAGLTYAQACIATPTANGSNDIGPSTDNCGGSRFSNIVSSGGARQRFSAKFPYLSDLARWYGTDTSNYSGLQVSLTARNFYGVSMTSGYTYSRANSSDGGTNAYNPGLDYGRTGSDVRQRFTLSPTYVLPSVTGYYGLLEGWRLNSVFRYQTGLPWTVGTFGNGSTGNGRNGRPDFYGDAADFKFYSPEDPPAIFHPGGPDPVVTAGTVASCSQNRPLNTCVGTINPNLNVPANTLYTSADLAINTAACAPHATTATHLARLRAYGCWERNGSVIMPSDLFSFGNMPKGRFDGPTYWNLDFSVTKRQRITERISTEFRVEAFNIFNHPDFDQPENGTGCSATGCTLGQRASETPDVGATNPVLGSGGPRRFQMGVKIIF
jgi:hypothetical protein